MFNLYFISAIAGADSEQVFFPVLETMMLYHQGSEVRRAKRTYDPREHVFAVARLSRPRILSSAHSAHTLLPDPGGGSR